MRTAHFPGVALLAALVASAYGCSGDDASDSSSKVPYGIVGTWARDEAATPTRFFEFHEDKTFFEITTNGDAAVCERGTYAFGDGKLTTDKPNGTPVNDFDTYTAELSSDGKLRLEEVGTSLVVVYRRGSLPNTARCQR